MSATVKSDQIIHVCLFVLARDNLTPFRTCPMILLFLDVSKNCMDEWQTM